MKNNKFLLSVTATAVIFLISAQPVLRPAAAVTAPAQMEYLDRGTVAVKTKDGVYLSWRLLGTENYDTAFDVYRDSKKIATISDSTNYTDTQCGESYTIVPSGKPVSAGKAVTVWDEQYITLPLDRPTGGTSLDGVEYTYSPNDVEPADVDGDGEYELILKWEPSNSFDSGKDAHHNGNVYIDCYEMDGTKLWRIDMGININAGAHFTQIAAYDFDLDGKAELAFKTAPGTKDGQGKFVSEASSIEEIKETDNSADYRHSEGRENDTGGRVLSGPEYYTVFQGDTGAALDTVYYPHPRGRVSAWGDNWGNRSERYLTAVAYLDGQRPSMIAWRGYYAKTTATAYNLVNKKLVQVADFDTSTDGNGRYAGNGNHNLTVGDVDNDGCDEIICGSLCLDDDLSVLWCSGRGHGDALHLADYDPTHEGMEYFSVHEDYGGGRITGSTNGNDGKQLLGGMTLYAAEDGTELFHEDGYGDTGRGMMANVGYGDGYFELWGAGNFVSHGDTNVEKVKYSPDSTNFRIFWDGDLYDELLDGTGGGGSQIKISGGGEKGRVQSLRNVSTINGTKNNPCLQADLLGDWREEIVAKGSDSSLLIYTTTIPTEHKLYTLMHDRAYRMQVASQNSAYNQPPHISYYVSEDNDEYDARKTAAYVSTVHNGETAVRSANLPSALFEFSIKAMGNQLRITNMAQRETDAVVYIAKYNNGILGNLNKQEITIAEKGYTGEIDADAGDTVYLWDEDMKPLAKKATVKAVQTPKPTSTPTPTAKPTPTPTLKATATPTVKPTQTPTDAPSPTASPLPEPVSEFVVDKEGVLVEYTGTDLDIVIPEEVNGEKVTGIGADAFSYNDEIESVIIPDTVTQIADNAFFECSALTYVKLPENLSEISAGIFHNCSSLISVDMPKYGCETINCRAFSDCVSLKMIDIPEGVTLIDSNAFVRCEALESVNLPDSLTEMYVQVFAGCTSLKSVHLPAELGRIEASTFEGCSSLTDITIPKTVTIIGDAAFEGCSNLRAVNIENAEEIGNRVFCDCSLIEEVTLGENIYHLGGNAFSHCSGLKKITVKSKTINLSRAKIENLNDTSIYGYIGSKAECFALVNDIPFYNLETGERVIKEWIVDGDGILQKYKGSGKDIIIPSEAEGVAIIGIGEEAFFGSDITSVELPDSIETIGLCAFEDCASLKTVKLSSGMAKLDDIFTGCTSLEKVIIPASITAIDARALTSFDECQNLTLYVAANSFMEFMAQSNNIPYVVDETLPPPADTQQ